MKAISVSQFLLKKNTDNKMTMEIMPMFGSEVSTLTIADRRSFISLERATVMVLVV
ncbi:hypothetical protein D3C78_1161680 [compost metagenome]